MLAPRLLILALTLSLILIAYPIRIQGAAVASSGHKYASDEDPPTPPKDDEKYKQCLAKCTEYVDKYWPQCKDRQNSVFDLCSMVDMLCVHRCTSKDAGWSNWMDAVSEYFEQLYHPME
ncbi:hypothetical protein BGZ72_001260 [Mortierella alpina]|nr:hypothetical protein BGZ72_001260 [Mortierella alpina]